MLTLVVVVRVFGVGCADDNKPSARTKNFDRSTVEPAQHLGREYFVGGTEREASVGEVQDAVDHAQHRVDVVGDQEHARAGRTPVAIDEANDGLLIREVKARERFITQEQPRLVGKRLANAKPLLLAAGEEAHRPIGKALRADGCDERINPGAIASLRERKSEPVAIHSEGDEITPPQSGLRREWPLLRDVSDAAITAASNGCAEGSDRALAQGLEPQDRAQKSGLARTTGAENCDKLAGGNVKVKPTPQFAIVPAKGSSGDPQRRGGTLGRAHFSSALARVLMLSCIHEK